LNVGSDIGESFLGERLSTGPTRGGGESDR
jgi:hypothetical protein